MKSKFEIITIEKKGLWAICQRCSHEWLYCGIRNFANCPKYHTTVTFDEKHTRKSVKEGA